MSIHAITYFAILIYATCICLTWITAWQMRQHWKMWLLLALVPTLLIIAGILEIQEAKIDKAHALLHGTVSLSTALALTIWVYTLRGVHSLISDQEKNLEVKAHYDDLTGLLRRDAWIESTQRELARAERSSKPIAVIEFDIDDFKRVNDTYGHAAGDQLLKSIACLSRSISRPSDILGRIGGEEFFFALPETDLVEATAFAERLRDTVSQNLFHIDEWIIRATISLGVSVGDQFRQGLPGLPLLMKSADEAMYQAKAAGKNCVR